MQGGQIWTPITPLRGHFCRPVHSHPGYVTSPRVRKRIEEAFGWMKSVVGLRQTRFRGRDRVDLAFIFAAAAYNPVRLPRLLAETPP